MEINIAKTAAKNLIDLINLDNGTALTEAEIALGIPSEWSDGNGGVDNDRNTLITISAVEGGGYTDSVDVRYYRLDVDVLKGALVLERQLTETSTLETVRDAMAATVGLIEDQVHLTDDLGVALTELPTIPEGETGTVYLTALDESLTYFGTTPVTLVPYVVDTPVGDEVTTTDLSGFDEPA